MWEIREKKGKYYRKWKPSKAEAFGILAIVYTIVIFIIQFVRG